MGVAFSPDGKRLTTACWDGVIRVWDLEDLGEGNFNSRLHLTLLESTDFFDIVFNPDGQRLIASTREGTTIGWEISQDEAQKSFTLSGHTSTVSRLAISPNGTRLATASYDGTAKIWDLNDATTFAYSLYECQPFHPNRI